MGPRAFIALVITLSTVVYLVNYAFLPTLDAEVRQIGGSSLSVEVGKLHVLVTGAAGFIGSHACLALLEAGHTVTVSMHLTSGLYTQAQSIACSAKHFGGRSILCRQ